LPEEEEDAEDARAVARLIRAAGRKAIPLPGDVRDEASCRRMVEDAVRGLGGLGILVNHAGHPQAQASRLDITTGQFGATFKTDACAMFWIARAARRHLPPGAAIVNAAPVTAHDPPEGLVGYAAPKAAIINFTRSMAKPLGPKGIRVNAVAPGPHRTPLQPCGGQDPEKLPQFGADKPLGRPGQPAGIAPLCVTLASDDGGFTSGNVFGSTGGSPAG
jgi:NAD(P)-dependent dehydrogenase (short-subunit alcohol dehydrogenase family)